MGTDFLTHFYHRFDKLLPDNLMPPWAHWFGQTPKILLVTLKIAWILEILMHFKIANIPDLPFPGLAAQMIAAWPYEIFLFGHGTNLNQFRYVNGIMAFWAILHMYNSPIAAKISSLSQGWIQAPCNNNSLAIMWICLTSAFHFAGEVPFSYNHYRLACFGFGACFSTNIWGGLTDHKVKYHYFVNLFLFTWYAHVCNSVTPLTNWQCYFACMSYLCGSVAVWSGQAANGNGSAKAKETKTA